MMDPTPRDIPAEQAHYWERIYESSLVEFLKRGWAAEEALRTAATTADRSVTLRAERFAKK